MKNLSSKDGNAYVNELSFGEKGMLMKEPILCADSCQGKKLWKGFCFDTNFLVLLLSM